METISFEVMFRILEECSAVVWGDMQMVVYPSYWTPNEEDGEEQFLHLEGVDSDFNEYEVNFKEKDNREVKVKGKHFYLKDTSGEEVLIRPLFTRDLNKYVDYLAGLELAKKQS